MKLCQVTSIMFGIIRPFPIFSDLMCSSAHPECHELSRASSSVKPPEQGGWDIDSVPSPDDLVVPWMSWWWDSYFLIVYWCLVYIVLLFLLLLYIVMSSVFIMSHDVFELLFVDAKTSFPAMACRSRLWGPGGTRCNGGGGLSDPVWPVEIHSASNVNPGLIKP